MSTTSDSDENTRVGLWVAFGAAFLVVAAVVGGVVVKQLRGPAAVPAAPAAAAAAPLAAGTMVEEIVLIEAPLEGELLGTLYFELAKAELPAEAAALAEAARQALAQAGSRRIVISGFHDASGDPAFNAELAKQRAIAARDALLAAGAEPARVQLRKPESTTGDGSAPEARRVEVRVVE
jgi:outer membrane protein OmpA-like peptidoglycan-associated protein